MKRIYRKQRRPKIMNLDVSSFPRWSVGTRGISIRNYSAGNFSIRPLMLGWIKHIGSTITELGGSAALDPPYIFY